MSPVSDQLEMSSSEAFNVPKLKGNNYSMWAGNMQSVLQSKYLWLVVKGIEICPTAPTATISAGQTAAEYKAEKREYLNWLLRDEAAQGIMMGACENLQLPYVKNCKLAKEMQDTLKKVHITNQSHINVHYFFEDLYTRKYVDGMPMADHIASMLDIKQQIINAGETLEDLHVARAMVLSLPKTQSWDVIKIQLFDVESAKLTSEAVSTKLQSKANSHAREKAGGNTALYTHHKGKSKGKGSNGKGKWQAKPTNKCWYCHHLGHWTRHCPQHEEDKKKASGTQSANLTVSHLHDLGTREVG
jgi:hypothetical protein